MIEIFEFRQRTSSTVLHCMMTLLVVTTGLSKVMKNEKLNMSSVKVTSKTSVL